MLTISKAAKYLGVHPDTLRRWDKKGKLSAKRNPNNNYRYYSVEQLNNFLNRGKESKIKILWEEGIFLQERIKELKEVEESLDVIVGSGISSQPETENLLLELNKKATARGVTFRFIRDLSRPRMKSLAKMMNSEKIETRNNKVLGVTISIRDKKVVRIEIPTDEPKRRINILINDSKAAKTFTNFFNDIWESSAS